MKAEDRVVLNMWRYPSIFPTKAAVLDHLFYVIGNGYEWDDGELKEFEELSPHYAYYPHGPGDTTEYLNWPHKTPEENQQIRMKHHLFNERMRSEIDMRSTYMGPYSIINFKGLAITHGGYPESRYSAINNLPNDIKPDWAALADEAKQWHDIYGERNTN